MPDSARGELQGLDDREPDSIRGMLGALHRAGTVLIKRGTAMGPLVPIVLLVPVLGGLGWLFEDTVVIRGVPVFTALCFAVIVVIVGHYLWHYSSFARNAPDRLQSEQYRTEMQQLRIAAKGLPEPIPADNLDDPVVNPKLPSEQAGPAGGRVRGGDEEDDS